MQSFEALLEQLLQHIPAEEEVYAQLQDILNAEDWKKHRLELRILIAPTGEIQDLSIRDGWGEEFLKIAAELDSFVH